MKEQLERQIWEMKLMGGNNKEATVITVNGFQIRGKIKRLEEGFLVIRDNADYSEKIIFFHAISTIA